LNLDYDFAILGVIISHPSDYLTTIVGYFMLNKVRLKYLVKYMKIDIKDEKTSSSHPGLYVVRHVLGT